MAKKRRRRKQAEEPQVENRRETRLRARERERNLRLMSIIGGIVGVALILILYGVVNELIIKPNSVLAQVEDRTIVTRNFWQQARLRQSELENQRLRLQIFAQQFGDSSLFASQIASINATLASPLTLGTQVLNDLIEGAVLQIKAPDVGVAVTDEEVEKTLREEVARGQGALTVPQATATADAAIEATATAETFTPTPLPSPSPTPEDDANSAPTATAAGETTETQEEEAPTPEPPRGPDRRFVRGGAGHSGGESARQRRHEPNQLSRSDPGASVTHEDVGDDQPGSGIHYRRAGPGPPYPDRRRRRTAP